LRGSYYERTKSSHCFNRLSYLALASVHGLMWTWRPSDRRNIDEGPVLHRTILGKKTRFPPLINLHRCIIFYESKTEQTIPLPKKLSTHGRHTLRLPRPGIHRLVRISSPTPYIRANNFRDESNDVRDDRRAPPFVNRGEHDINDDNEGKGRPCDEWNRH